MEFIKGRDNLACTIFIPVDCGNNCKFCMTKSMYKDFVFDNIFVNRIVKWIDILNSNDMISEFVITGGEPTKNLKVLKKIVSACKKPVYINTSLPKQDDMFDVISYINQTNIIKCINISRHIGLKYDVPVYGTDIIDMIKKPVRINCVVNEDTLTIEQIENMLKMYNKKNIMLNLRADYRNITDANLKSRDKVFNLLFDEYLYTGSNSCLVCNSSFFTTNTGKIICYHRGVEHSAVETKNRIYINDIVINNKGFLFYDWNMESNTINGKFLEFLLDADSKMIDGIKEYKEDLELMELEVTDSSHLRKLPNITPSKITVYNGCGYTPRKKKKKTISSSCGMGQSNCGINTSTISGCGLPVRNCGGSYTYGYSGCGIRSGC